MKKLTYIFIAILFTAFGCSDDGYIDPITPVDPGPDVAPPIVEIDYPLEGTKIQVVEDITSIDFKFEVIDDIEIESITILLDNVALNTYDSFLDYRRAEETYDYHELTNGDHVFSVEAADMSGKVTKVNVNFEKVEPYQPVYDGETLYMPFDGSYMDLLSITNPDEVGDPSFATGAIGQAYAGTENSYLLFPTDGLLGSEFSAVFWYNVNAVPDRAGILVIGPPDAANPTAQNNRTSGFRLFRENAGGKQRIKLNVGNGTADSWFDGGAAADIDPAGGWVHIAFTISPTECKVYIDGEVVKEGAFTGVDWTGCDLLTIMSGAPRFAGWNHLSDNSLMDELRLFDAALTQEQIQQIIDDES